MSRSGPGGSDHCWELTRLRWASWVDLAPGHYDVWVVGPHNTAFRSVGLEAGSTRFIEVTFANEAPINYRLKEISDGAGRASVLAGKRAREIR